MIVVLFIVCDYIQYTDEIKCLPYIYSLTPVLFLCLCDTGVSECVGVWIYLRCSSPRVWIISVSAFVPGTAREIAHIYRNKISTVIIINRTILHSILYCLYCTLYYLYCTLYCLYCTLYYLYCTLYYLYCTLYYLYCTLYYLYCTLYYLYCTLYCLYCTLYYLYCTLYYTVYTAHFPFLFLCNFMSFTFL